MATIIRGNGGNLSASDDNSDGGTIVLGNGAHDTVSAASSQYDTIMLGNGAGDTVKALGGVGNPSRRGARHAQSVRFQQ